MKIKHGLTMVAAAMAAHNANAQSSVTLYGLLDLGVTYVNSAQTSRSGSHLNGASQIALTDGHATGLSGSRWGLRGTEDLGGGLKAIFVLENGFMANSGALAQGGSEFGRQVYVGLSSNAGTVTVGRQYDPLVDFVQPLAASGQWAGYMGSHPDELDNLTNTNRINNSIKVVTPNYRGFSMGALYSFGGVAGGVSRNQIWALGGGYSNASVQIGVGYLNARDPNVSFYGNTPNKGTAIANNLGSVGSASAPESNPVYAGYASANTTQIISAGVAYTFSQTTIGAVVSNTRFYSLGSQAGPNPLGYSGSASFTNIELNGRVRVTPSLLLGAAFDYTDRNSVRNDGGAKYLQLDLGSDYSISKRTDLYALAVLQRATGRDSLGQASVASIAGFTPSATNKQVGLRVGIRHKF
ncbi:porin [Paraburkholderia dipogonis]|uniref:Porin n=1 Tax=Paraburkholderia dipogonis TaxID=1211383 RepID=A0ABW9AX00_9BURK